MSPMPTLLSVNNYYYRRGGAESVFLEHNRLFERRGWLVVPFAMRHPSNLPSDWSGHFVDEIEFGADYSLLQKLRRLPRVIYSREARTKLRRLLTEARPHVCHAHNIYHHISPSILGLLKAHGVPTVLTLHDLKVACPAYTMLTHDGICERCRGGRLHNVLVHRCIKGSAALSAVVFLEAVVHRLIGSYRRYVDLFAVPSRFYIDKLVEWGMPEGMFRHIPNFVEADRYEPRFDAGKDIVYFGRLAREKGLRTLISAAAMARCKLVLAGTGTELGALTRLASQIGADVTFPGHLSGSALHEAVRNARAVVLPSEWYENAPMSVLEAYALGKPVIGADIGGIPELVRAGDTGLHFRSGDASALADALRRISNMSDSHVAEMGRSGRRWVETEFTADTYASRVLESYRELGVDTDSLRSPMRRGELT
jgi:glycosyltransferase involved in cell wall biosynthesis